ncbi:MAG: hypothetical protein ACXVHB_06065 [Solirubrobacteraceae bacterium]
MRAGDTVAALAGDAEGEIIDVQVDREAPPDSVAGFMDVAWSDEARAETLPVFKATGGALICFDCKLKNRHHTNSMLGASAL